MACASSRCFFAETAVMRLGTILPRSDTKRCSSLTSLWSILGAFAPEKGQLLRRRKNGRRAPPADCDEKAMVTPPLPLRALRRRREDADRGRGLDPGRGDGRRAGRRG